MFTEGRSIVLNDAEGQQVILYDITSRLISNNIATSINVSYEVNAAGVYLLHVGNKKNFRIVVK